MTCGRCGEEFDEPVDGGCPGCGRKVVEGTPGRRPPPARVYSEESGSWTWRLLALAAVAVLGGAGWFVYKKVTAVPPPPAVEAPKKKVTLKDWQAVVPPAKFIPALDALRLQAAKDAPPEAVVEEIRRVLTGAEQLHAQVLLLSALEGTSGKRAVPPLAVLALRLPMPVAIADEDDLRSFRTLAAKTALSFVDDKVPEARQGAAACLIFLADQHVRPDGTKFRALSAETLAATREACQRLAKDPHPETRQAAEKALEFLSR